MALTGLGNADAKYVMIDEVQDYTVAQLAVLARYFKRAHFLLLGDQNQAIAPGTATFDQVRALFREVRGPLEECRLMTSYRSTPEITQLFASLLDDDERLSISSIQRADTAPEIIACASEQDYDRELRRVLAQAVGDDGLTAVVVPQKHQAKLLRKKLGDAAPALIDAAATLPASGVVLVPLKLAKGLEFDHVIVPDASERAFPDDPLSRRRLYTTVSRATRGITLLAQGEITPLLAARA